MHRNRWILGGVLLFALTFMVDRWVIELPEPLYLVLSGLGVIAVLLGCVRDNSDHS